MKFRCTVEIDLPLQRVVALWKDPDNYTHWQDGFKEIKHLSGQRGEKDSTSRILLNDGKREIELKETILENNLPESFRGLYEHKHMTNTMTSRFERISDKKTIYSAEVEYTKFNGILPTLMAKLMPGMFRKQTQKWLDNFKSFAENAIS